MMVNLSPMGRVSTVKDIADAVMYLTDAATVTGDILYVDGGGSGTRPLVIEKSFSHDHYLNGLRERARLGAYRCAILAFGAVLIVVFSSTLSSISFNATNCLLEICGSSTQKARQLHFTAPIPRN